MTIESVMIAYFIAYAETVPLSTGFVRAAALLEINHPGLLAMVQADQERRIAENLYMRARAENPANLYEWLANDFHAHHRVPVTVMGVSHAS